MSHRASLLRIFLCFLVCTLLAHPVRAQRGPEDTALLWFTLDSSRLGPSTDAKAQHAVIESVALWLKPGRIIQDATTERLVIDVISESLVHAVPVSLCVFALQEEHGKPGDPVPSRLRTVRFAAVLSIRTGAAMGQGHEQIRAGITDLLADSLPGPNQKAERRTITVEGRASVLHYRRYAWEAWRSITILESPDRIDIGLGEGEHALRQWLIASDGHGTPGPIAAHRAAARAGIEGALPVAELFINIDRLRHAFPDRFGADPGARFLAALHLANARSFMLHALTPVDPDHPLEGAGTPLSMHATWSSRAEPESRTHRRPITFQEPLADAPRELTRPGVHAALASLWTPWTNLALDACAGMLDERDSKDFERRRGAWATRRLPTLARLDNALDTGAVATLDRERSGVAFGAVVLRIPLKPGAKPEAVKSDLRAVLDPFASRISTDDRNQTFWLRSPAPALIRVLSWRMTRHNERDLLEIAIDFGLSNDWNWRAP